MHTYLFHDIERKKDDYPTNFPELMERQVMSLYTHSLSPENN